MTGQVDLTSGYRERNSTADRALDILLMFGDDQLTVSAVDVAEHIGVARSTAYRYLQSLVQARFIEEATPASFRLASRVLELARLARQGLGLSEVARPVMTSLAAATGETVLLTRLSGTVVVCLEREEAVGRRVRLSYERGQVLPANAGASAYALLAWLPEAEANDVIDRIRLERFTPTTLTSRKALRQRLAASVACGYAVARGELDSDILGVGAPIRDANDRVAAALSVAAVSSRVPEDRVAELGRQVVAACAEISQQLVLVG